MRDDDNGCIHSPTSLLALARRCLQRLYDGARVTPIAENATRMGHSVSLLPLPLPSKDGLFVDQQWEIFDAAPTSSTLSNSEQLSWICPVIVLGGTQFQNSRNS
jgi:hypothetical protein